MSGGVFDAVLPIQDGYWAALDVGEQCRIAALLAGVS